MKIRGLLGALYAALAIFLSCAHTGSEIPVGPCPAKHQMNPLLELFCGANRRGDDYVMRVHEAILRALHFPLSGGVSGFVSISYGKGPVVESVCWFGFGDQLEEAQLIDMARRVARIQVPRQLECFEGHRLVHELLKEWQGPFPELPPGWKRM